MYQSIVWLGASILRSGTSFVPIFKSKLVNHPLTKWPQCHIKLPFSWVSVPEYHSCLPKNTKWNILLKLIKYCNSNSILVPSRLIKFCTAEVTVTEWCWFRLLPSRRVASLDKFKDNLPNKTCLMSENWFRLLQQPSRTWLESGHFLCNRDFRDSFGFIFNVM